MRPRWFEMLRYILEYIAICDFLCKEGTLKRKRGFLIVDRQIIESMLNMNKFEPAKDKLKVWKQLNWIATDEDRLTKRIYQDGKYVSMVFIDEKVYKEMKRIRAIDKEQSN